MSLTPTHKPYFARWCTGAMFAATFFLPGCAGSDEARPQRPTADAVLQSAQQSAAAGDTGAALTQYEEAIALNPKLASAYLGAADLYSARGDLISAERRYGKAAELEPRNFDAQYKHGLTLQVLGRYGEAVRAYLRAIPLKPDDFNASLNAATTYLQLGEPKQAALFAQYAVKLDPSSGVAHVNLAEINRALGRHEPAVEAYQQAALIGELTPDVMLNFADSLGQIGRYADMAEVAGRVIEAAPSALAHERLGTAQFELGKADEALASFQKALELDPNFCPALNGIGVCMLNKHIASGETDREALNAAIAAFRRSLQIDRSQPRVAELLARWG